jgi:hypothetical protein
VNDDGSMATVEGLCLHFPQDYTCGGGSYISEVSFDLVCEGHTAELGRSCE